MEQPPSHPVPGTHAPGMPRDAPGSYTLASPRAAPTRENRPGAPHHHHAPGPAPWNEPDRDGAGTGTEQNQERGRQPLVPNPIARYSFSSALVGSLAYTCDMNRCPCE